MNYIENVLTICVITVLYFVIYSGSIFQMVHQLGRAGGQHLVGEVIGALFHSPDIHVVEAGAASLKQLLCSLLNVSCLKASE